MTTAPVTPVRMPETIWVYDVVTSDEYKRFVDQINSRIREGWLLQGGVSISSDSCFRYAQALRKQEIV